MCQKLELACFLRKGAQNFLVILFWLSVKHFYLYFLTILLNFNIFFFSLFISYFWVLGIFTDDFFKYFSIHYGIWNYYSKDAIVKDAFPFIKCYQRTPLPDYEALVAEQQDSFVFYSSIGMMKKVMG